MLIDPKHLLPPAEDLEEFFFASMNEVGYPLENPPIQGHPLIKGWKTIIRSIPFFIPHLGYAELVFQDSWGKEFGRTTITLRFDGIPGAVTLWCMIYSGKYSSANELGVIKNILRSTYKAKFFCGGRGAVEYREGSFRYHNAWHGDFTQFWGEEMLYDDSANPGNEFRGAHRYWGGLLIPAIPHSS